MADTERLINKAQGDSIISAIQGITARLQEMYTVDDALSSTSEHPVQNKVVKAALDDKVDKVTGKGLSTNDYTNDEKALVATIPNKADSDDVAGTQTASGNPLTLTDCAPINAESLVVELLPKQDLHGQQYPYVGGAGKNKLPMTVDGIKAANTDGTWSGNVYSINNGTFTVITDDGGNVTGIKVNGAFNADVDLFLNSSSNYLSSNDTMILNGCPSGGSFDTSYSLVLYSTSSGGGYPMADNDTGSGAQNTEPFINGAVAIKVVSGYTASNLVFYPMLRLATESDPTFAPYSNICPITGYTECEVDDVGKNKLNLSDYTGNSYAAYGFATTISGEDVIVTLTNYPMTGATESFEILMNTDAIFDKTGLSIKAFISSGDNYVSSVRWSNIQSNNNIAIDLKNLSQGLNATITMRIMVYDTSSGEPTTYEPYQSRTASVTFGQTVYGGVVDFKTGVVTITDANIASYAGETLPSTWISDRDAYSSGGTPTTGAQVVYKLSTPTTLQLTPQELKLLKGTNHITTNGTTITLGYQPDNVIGHTLEVAEDYTDRAVGKNILPMTLAGIKAANPHLTWTDETSFTSGNVTVTFQVAGGDIYGIHIVSTGSNGEFFNLCFDGADYSRFDGCILSGCDVNDENKIYIAIRKYGGANYFAKNISGDTVINYTAGQKASIFVYLSSGSVDTVLKPMIRKPNMDNTYTPPKPSTEILMDLIAYLFKQI